MTRAILHMDNGRWQDEFLKDGDMDIPNDPNFCAGKCGILHSMNPACAIDKEWLDRRSLVELHWIIREAKTWTDCSEYVKTRVALLVLEQSMEEP